MANPTPFTRLRSSDPETNRIVQDLYDKIAQLQESVNSLVDRVKKLEPK